MWTNLQDWKSYAKGELLPTIMHGQRLIGKINIVEKNRTIIKKDESVNSEISVEQSLSIKVCEPGAVSDMAARGNDFQAGIDGVKFFL